MNFEKYKPMLKQYLQLKGYKDFSKNVSCFSGNHEDSKPSMSVKKDGYKCYSCDFKGDVFDAIGHFEHITEKKDQFIFAEKLFENKIIPVSDKKRFEIDEEAYEIVSSYMRSQRLSHEGFINDFVEKRGYSGKLAAEYSRYLGYWPGHEKAFGDLGEEVLKKAGIPEKGWFYAGIVCKFDNGWKLMYVKGKETVKRGSHGSKAFPYPGLPEGDKIGLVEAELSAIACRIIGLDYVVSTGGTNGLSKKDLEKLLNYKEIVFIFDGDKPGNDAVEKIVNKLSDLGYDGIIKQAILPDNKDPDDLIKAGDNNLLTTCLKDANTLQDTKPVTHKDIIDIVDEEVYDDDADFTYKELTEILENSFFIINAIDADKLRRNIKMIRDFIYFRPELAFQEAARLYFCEIHKNGIKIQESSTNEMIWIYDTSRKYWNPLTDKINHEPSELFIKKYSAKWWKKGCKTPFHFKKGNKTRSEIEKCFIEYVKGNIIPEQEPFSNNTVKKVISCKNCVLEWDFEKKKFSMSDHGPEHNLTVSPFPYNRIDTKKLNKDQEKRREAIKKYFYGLVKWIDDEIENPEKAQEEKDNVLNFLFAYIGYTLTPWREKCFHVWIGSKDSGKSTLKEIIKIIHGNKYAEADFSRWNKQKSPHDNEILPGKLVLADDDFEVGARLPERELKTLSQNGTVTINPKHISQYTIMNTATPLILTNGLPRAEDITLENRLYALPFKSNFGREKRNIESEKFINYIKEHETLEVLFNIAIDLAEKSIFVSGNFEEFKPDIVKKTSAKIIDSASSVLMWIDDMSAQNKLDVDKNNLNIRIKRTDLYQMYQQNSSGMKKGLHSFYEAVRQKFKDDKSGGIDYFYGIERIIEMPKDLPYKD